MHIYVALSIPFLSFSPVENPPPLYHVSEFLGERSHYGGKTGKESAQRVGGGGGVDYCICICILHPSSPPLTEKLK